MVRMVPIYNSNLAAFKLTTSPRLSISSSLIWKSRKSTDACYQHYRELGKAAPLSSYGFWPLGGRLGASVWLLCNVDPKFLIKCTQKVRRYEVRRYECTPSQFQIGNILLVPADLLVYYFRH